VQARGRHARVDFGQCLRMALLAPHHQRSTQRQAQRVEPFWTPFDAAAVLGDRPAPPAVSSTDDARRKLMPRCGEPACCRRPAGVSTASRWRGSWSGRRGPASRARTTCSSSTRRSLRKVATESQARGDTCSHARGHACSQQSQAKGCAVQYRRSTGTHPAKNQAVWTMYAEY